MNTSTNYPIGIPGQPWGAAELAQWRSKQTKLRSYARDVLSAVDELADRFNAQTYGSIAYEGDQYSLIALESRVWRNDLPCVLITGGVHGYETSGVQGVLRYLQTYASVYEGRVNFLAVPCVSPWAYERIQRWNFDAVDPNRSFREGGRAEESMALTRLVAPLRGQWAMHLDLHETTDSDESEFRPALAARDGKVFEPCGIPDGFYVVDDSGNPKTAFQEAIIAAVERVTHIAQSNEMGQLIGSPAVKRGIIQYDMKSLGLCASVSNAPFTCTTEVYPDSPRTTPQQCIAAQVAAVCAALEFLARR